MIIRSSSRVKCEYMRKTCESGCDNHTCRAYFPIKQPLIDPNSKDVCLSDDHATECLIYIEGKKWREEKRLKGLKEKCPFASNSRCGREWEWWCKGGNYPFLLTTFEVKEGTHDLPVKNSDGSIKFTYDKEIVDSTCLSGDEAIYTECPNYKEALHHREIIKRLKKSEKQ